MRRVVVVSLWVALAGARSFAQSPQSPDETVPAELLRAVLAPRSPFGARASVVAGRAPVGWPAELVPPASTGRVVGTIDEGHRTTLVVATAAVPETAVPAMKQSLAQRGWQLAPEPASRGGFGGSFIVPHVDALCRNDSLVTVTGAPRVDGGGHLYVTLQPAPAGRMMCHRQDVRGDTRSDTRSDVVSSSSSSVTFVESATPAARGSGVPPSGAPVPALTPPDGVRPLGSRSSGGMDEWSGEVTLVGAASASDLVAHYGRQLVTAGWTLGERVLGRTVAVQRAERRDSSGVAWRALMTATDDAAQRHTISLQIARGRP